MKTDHVNRLALAACVLATIATGARAADPTMESDGLIFAGTLGGAVGAHYATAAGDDSDGVDVMDGTAFTIAGQGAVSIPLGEMLALQLDGANEFYTRSSDDEDDADSAGVFGAHLSLRDPGLGLIGILGGVGLGSSIDDSHKGQLGWFVGGEGQMYFGNLTLYAQVGYADFQVDDDTPDGEGFVEAWFAGGEARYFITDDMMLNANVSYGATDSYVDGEDQGDAWNWGVGGAMRLTDSMPIYATADYRGGRYYADDGGEEIVQEQAFLVGLSFLFGAPSLLENDRRGATLSSPMLPARAAAWTEALD